MVKDLPAMQETGVQFLGPIPGVGRSPGEGNATYSRILAWKIPWGEDPGGSPGVQESMGSQRVGHDRATNTFTFLLLKICELI